MRKYLKLMRVHHYIKNLLIFLPLIFSKRFFEIELLKNATIGFLSFSLMTSSVYIINDISDADKDRMHSTKCKRPIASGEVSVRKAWLLTVVLIVLSVVMNLFVTGDYAGGLIYMVAYFLLNIAYSLRLKNIPILDVTVLASGFLLRLLYGSSVTEITISTWFCLTMILGSFYLALGKRRNELIREGADKREVLKLYSYNFLDKNMYMCLCLAIVFYSLWTIDNSFGENLKLVWTVPLVLFIGFKYSLNIERDSDGDPTEVILGDKVLITMVALYAAITGGILYGIV